jgi:hypothetical protein
VLPKRPERGPLSPRGSAWQQNQKQSEHEWLCHGFNPSNDQLTDGGPSVTLEFSTGVAGPPSGAAPFFGVRLIAVLVNSITALQNAPLTTMSMIKKGPANQSGIRHGSWPSTNAATHSGHPSTRRRPCALRSHSVHGLVCHGSGAQTMTRKSAPMTIVATTVITKNLPALVILKSPLLN